MYMNTSALSLKKGLEKNKTKKIFFFIHGSEGKLVKGHYSIEHGVEQQLLPPPLLFCLWSENKKKKKIKKLY